MPIKPYAITNDKIKRGMKTFDDFISMWNWIEENAMPLERYTIDNRFKKIEYTIIITDYINYNKEIE